MNLKNYIAPTLAVMIATTFGVAAQAQVITNFGTPIQQGVPMSQFSTQQPSTQQFTDLQPLTKEQLAKVDMGAMLYDAGATIGVRSVYSNSPAQTAGIQSGDTITKVNGEAANLASLNTLLASKAAGDSVKLTRNRGGKETEVEVKLMAMSDIVAASNVPELNTYEQAIEQADRQIAMLRQEIKNTEEDLKDLNKRVADQESRITELKANAEADRKKVAAMKAAEEAKNASAEEAKKAADEAAKKAAADSAKKAAADEAAKKSAADDAKKAAEEAAKKAAADKEAKKPAEALKAAAPEPATTLSTPTPTPDDD